MKILVILSALLTAVVSANGFAVAGVTPGSAMPAQETAAVSAMRAFVGRCVPGVMAGSAPVNTGFARVDPATEAGVLGVRRGDVWQDRAARLLMVAYDDAPVCRIIALSVDPAVLADIVIRVFREADTPFKRERFRMDVDGGFAAVYSAPGTPRGVVVRINTDRRADGSRFATLSVEQAMPLTD